jgi:hypothetical protein
MLQGREFKHGSLAFTVPPFGDYLRRGSIEMARRGLSGSDLARIAKVSPATVSTR